MFEFFDLSHALNEHNPTFSGECGFKKKLISDYPEPRVYSFECHAGIATHMDAPCHFIKEGRSIDELPLHELFGPLCIVDVREKAHPDYRITSQDIHEYEKKYGKIDPGSIVCGLTGWGKKWKNTQEYRNVDDQGITRIPGFSKLIGPILLERNIAGLGIDTLSPDGSDLDFPLHHLLLGAGKFLLENLAHLEALPPRGAMLLALPIKVEKGSEAPVRAIAMIPKF